MIFDFTLNPYAKHPCSTYAKPSIFCRTYAALFNFLPIALTFFCEENMLFASQAISFFGSRINESHAPRKTLDKDQILKTP